MKRFGVNLGLLIAVMLLVSACVHNVQCSSVLPAHLKPTAGDMTAFLEADSAELFPYHLCRAKNDEEAGQYNVGIAYQEGLGVEQDYEDAIKWYTKAAEPKSDLKWTYGSEIAIRTRPIYAGHKEAQYRLGMMYFYGLGTSRDYDKASKWFRQSSAQGYLPARARLLQLENMAQSGLERN